MTNPNPFTLAAENSPRLLPLLQSQPELASSQDSHGYIWIHSAASYNHLVLLRTLVLDFTVDVNTKDEDGETALFAVESVEAAQVLCEELRIDQNIRNAEGETAGEKILQEGNFTAIADYLRIQTASGTSLESALRNGDTGRAPPLPPNVKMQVGTLEDPEALGEVADPSLRQRIEELAAREDFQGEDGQRQLRELITDAVRDVSRDEREVRPRLE